MTEVLLTVVGWALSLAVVTLACAALVALPLAFVAWLFDPVPWTRWGRRRVLGERE